MSKKITLFLVIALMVSLVPALGAAAQDEVTITWWHIDTSDDQQAYWQGLADEYMAANPGVKVEITVLENEAFKSRLVTVMQAGDPPDIFRSWGGGVLWNYAENGLVRNIAPELEGEWKDSFSAQSALEIYGQDGEYYGAPYTWGAVGLFYNKELFAKAGLDPEVPPATWDEFLAAVQALKDAGITPIALGEADRWTGQFWWIYLCVRMGGQDAFLKAYNREGAFTDEPFVQAGDKLAELVALEPFAEGFQGMIYGDAQTMMNDEAAAMELMGQWAIGGYMGNDAEKAAVLIPKLGWMPFPVVEGGAGNPTDVLGGGDGWAVGANAEDEAVDFLKFLTSVEVQTGLVTSPLNTTPTVTGAEEAVTDPIIQTILKVRNEAPYFQLYYDQFFTPALGTAVLDATEGIFAQTLSGEDAAAVVEDVAAVELAQ